MAGEWVKKLKNERQLLQYALIGVTGVTCDLLSFILLTKYLLLPYLLANAVSVSLGIANNFFLNAFYNFKVKDRLMVRFLRFYSIGLFGLALSSGLLFLLVQVLAAGQLAAKLLTAVMVALVQFYLNKTITFTDGEKHAKIIHSNSGIQ